MTFRGSTSAIAIAVIVTGVTMSAVQAANDARLPGLERRVDTLVPPGSYL
jgi:hypothetical protein